ncbi:MULTISPECIES: hypothetical protein [unclassified Kitasatospora]|uniref:hypothetical protein n=1 Tax=unclassified Kitasatospora TaxID=2633591 RepID=UPI0034024B16
MAQRQPFGPSVPWALRLLLLAALLLGVVTMHTLGHPTGGHGGYGGYADHGGHRDPGPRAVAAQQPPEHHVMAGRPGPAEPVRSATADPVSSDGGMDPMTVCLAVLAAWTLVLLAAGPLLRRRGDAAADVRARLLRAVRALPPPGGGRILLARLSVLRQ